MSSDPRLMALPALRKRAEEQAKALSEVCADTFALHMGADMPAMYERGWDGMHEDERDALTAAHLSLLSDLTRPESRDAVARLVAEALLVPVEFSAPSLWRMAHTVWAFAAMSDCSEAVKNDGVWFIPTPGSTADRIRSVPALAGVTDPAEALTLIALAVFGGAS